MKTMLIAASALSLATPTFAQTTTTAPASNDPSVSAPATSEPQAATTAAPATPQDAKTIIASEFPSYDKDTSGALSKVEFETWMTTLKEKSSTTPMKTTEKTAWLKSAFATADKDKNKAVSLAELTDYLTAQG